MPPRRPPKSHVKPGPTESGAQPGPLDEAIDGLSRLKLTPSPSKLSPEEKKIIKTKQPLYGLRSGEVKGDRVRMALVRRAN